MNGEIITRLDLNWIDLGLLLVILWSLLDLINLMALFKNIFYPYLTASEKDTFSDKRE